MCREVGMAHIEGMPAYGRTEREDAGTAERLPLRWAVPAICGLAMLGWAAVLIPLCLLLGH